MSPIFSQLLGIDLGTANTLVYVKGKGIVINEPSVVAMRRGAKEVVAVGEEAKQMLGRTPGDIVAIRPLRDGVIADFDITQIMLKYFLKKTIHRGPFGGARVVICVPCGITEVEKRAVEEAARIAGAREAYLIDEPMAAAIGAGLDVGRACGNMIVDIGGGTSEVAVISLGGIVTSRSLRVGGNRMDQAIVDYIKEQYNVIIGESTAEAIKIAIGRVIDAPGKERQMEIRGRSLLTGLPQSLTIEESEVRYALKEPVEQIIAEVKGALEQTPPELAADISEQGIYLSGGTSKLQGLPELMQSALGMRVTRTEEPMEAVVQGAGLAAESLQTNKNHKNFTQRLQPIS